MTFLYSSIDSPCWRLLLQCATGELLINRGAAPGRATVSLSFDMAEDEARRLSGSVWRHHACQLVPYHATYSVTPLAAPGSPLYVTKSLVRPLRDRRPPYRRFKVRGKTPPAGPGSPSGPAPPEPPRDAPA